MSRIALRVFAPHPALAPLVECVWTAHSAAGEWVDMTRRVVADGAMDLIFSLGARIVPECSPEAPSSFVTGPNWEPTRVLHAGGIDAVGVRFRPGGGAVLFRTPASELANTLVPLAELTGSPAAAELEARLHGLPEAARVAAVQQALLALARAGAAQPKPLVRQALQRIQHSGGRVSVGELERELGTTRRQLQRHFLAQVGLTPKVFCRVTRFQQALGMLRRERSVAWSWLALACGFYDQAHLIREFRAFSGLTPEAYRAETEVVTALESLPASETVSPAEASPPDGRSAVCPHRPAPSRSAAAAAAGGHGDHVWTRISRHARAAG